MQKVVRYCVGFTRDFSVSLNFINALVLHRGDVYLFEDATCLSNYYDITTVLVIAFSKSTNGCLLNRPTISATSGNTPVNSDSERCTWHMLTCGLWATAFSLTAVENKMCNVDIRI